jgi:hypothetical protein
MNIHQPQHLELIEAKKYYGSQATGYVMIVNGHPYCHMPLSELKKTNIYKTWLKYKEICDES